MPTSAGVRVVPAVPGTRVHGRSLMVPVRDQNRNPPVHGLNLLVSGPQAPARFSDSRNIVQMIKSSGR